MEHSIRFTRPETRDTIARMYIPSEINPVEQIRRLRALGYSIIDVAPPLTADQQN